jgi:hypothetical protein
VPLDIQTGGFAEKIRRSTGVRGRMPLRLDETVIATIQTADLSEPPYRQNEIDFMGNCDKALVAAEYPFGGVALKTDVPGAAVVRGLLVTSEALDSYSLFAVPEVDLDATDDSAPPQLLYNVEHQPKAVAASSLYPMPFRAAIRGSDPTLGIGGQLLMTFRVLANENVIIPLRHTLRPSWGLALFRRTVNTAINVTWWGTYYPDGPGYNG